MQSEEVLALLALLEVIRNEQQFLLGLIAGAIVALTFFVGWQRL